MDSKYIITPSGNFVSADELYHWGIKGMKWGVRRYQNPDGTLTSAGKKRYTNADGSLNEKGKKRFGTVKTDSKESSSASTVTKKNPVSEMDDNDLQKRVNRLRNEDAYRDLSKKLGYDSPQTELDVKIAEMEKQKKYLELQRDIKNLTPKKVSKGKQLVEKIFSKVIEPAATEAGKKFLSQYLSDAAAKALKKEAQKTAEEAEKSAEKVKEKQAKKEAKQAQKNKKTSRTADVEDDYGKYTVEGVGASSRKSSNQTKNTSPKATVDADPWPMLEAPVTSLTVTKYQSNGEDWIRRRRRTNIAGYLPAPKDSDQ